MITKFQRCRGLRLFRWGRFQIELWYCPARETIPLHSHPNIDSTIVHLFGWVHWYIELDNVPYGKYLGASNIGKSHKVPANTVHAATCYSPLLFLNIERWSCTPSSAAIDFKPL